MVSKDRIDYFKFIKTSWFLRMTTKYKSIYIEVFIKIVLFVLLGYSIFKSVITGGHIVGMIPVVFHSIIALLLVAQSKYLPNGIKIWGALIMITGAIKISLQILVSSEDLVSNPTHLYKLALILLGFILWRIGARGFHLSEDIPSDQN